MAMAASVTIAGVASGASSSSVAVSLSTRQPSASCMSASRGPPSQSHRRSNSHQLAAARVCSPILSKSRATAPLSTTFLTSAKKLPSGSGASVHTSLNNPVLTRGSDAHLPFRASRRLGRRGHQDGLFPPAMSAFEHSLEGESPSLTVRTRKSAVVAQGAPSSGGANTSACTGSHGSGLHNPNSQARGRPAAVAASAAGGAGMGGGEVRLVTGRFQELDMTTTKTGISASLAVPATAAATGGGVKERLTLGAGGGMGTGLGLGLGGMGMGINVGTDRMPHPEAVELAESAGEGGSTRGRVSTAAHDSAASATLVQKATAAVEAVEREMGGRAGSGAEGKRKAIERRTSPTDSTQDGAERDERGGSAGEGGRVWREFEEEREGERKARYGHQAHVTFEPREARRFVEGAVEVATEEEQGEGLMGRVEREGGRGSRGRLTAGSVGGVVVKEREGGMGHSESNNSIYGMSSTAHGSAVPPGTADRTEQPPSLLIFTGGTAFNAVAEELKQWTHRVAHVLPVSDNGGSTAEIVRVMGGPAIGDIRSRCLRLSDSSTAEALAVKRLLGHRLALQPMQAKAEWLSIVEGEHELWHGVSEPYKDTIRAFLVHFQHQILRNAGHRFSFQNGSVGNFFFSGARSFFRSLDAAVFLFSRVSHIPADSLVLPCICTNDRLTLGAELLDRTIIRGQNEISHPTTPSSPCNSSNNHHAHLTVDKSQAGSPPLPSPIQRVFYMSSEGTNLLHEVFPSVNPRVLEQLRTVDAVVYGIGSLFTSICPSLILRGVGEVISERQCPKVLILNGALDRETAGMAASDFVVAISNSLNRTFGEDSLHRLRHSSNVYITHLLAPENGEIVIDHDRLAFLGVSSVRLVPSVTCDGSCSVLYDVPALVDAVREVVEEHGRQQRERGEGEGERSAIA